MVTYGHQVVEKHDNIIGAIDHAVTLATSLGSPGATIVDFLPICASGFPACLTEADVE